MTDFTTLSTDQLISHCAYLEGEMDRCDDIGDWRGYDRAREDLNEARAALNVKRIEHCQDAPAGASPLKETPNA